VADGCEILMVHGMTRHTMLAGSPMPLKILENSGSEAGFPNDRSSRFRHAGRTGIFCRPIIRRQADLRRSIRNRATSTTGERQNRRRRKT
jgi:hypothetical protein